MAETATRDFDALWEAAQGGDARARLALGRHYLEENDFGRARRWLGKAGRGGEPEGLTELGMLELQGLGMAADPAGAREHLAQARAAGCARARYELALLDYRAGRLDRDRAYGELTAAARAGYGPAQRQIGILLARSDAALAARVLACAATGGDSIAMSLLARLLHDREESAENAHAWAARANEAGAYCRGSLEPVAGKGIASEPSGPEPLPAAEIPTPPVEAAPAPEPETPLGDDRVRIYDDMVTPLECEYLIETAAPLLRPSHTVHPETGEAVLNEMRTSDGYSLHPLQEDFAILATKARLSGETGYPVSHAEPFALLRYQPGQEYQAHFDYIDPHSGEAGREIGVYGQREVTIFSYLTTTGAGGETAFPRHDIKVACRQGRALMFRNTLPGNSEVDPDSLHASLPVESGEKWIATLWVRTRTLQP